jgi:hypothetical protein
MSALVTPVFPKLSHEEFQFGAKTFFMSELRALELFPWMISISGHLSRNTALTDDNPICAV